MLTNSTPPGQAPAHVDGNLVCSVCIANFNGMGVIKSCLDSVFSQICDFPFEVIVHDDASSDGSVAYIREHYPTVRLIESTTNVGFCIANNRMAEIAKGQYIVLLNNDAALFPDALMTLHTAASADTKDVVRSLPQYDATTGELIDVGCLLDPFLNSVPNHSFKQHEVGVVAGACLWLSKGLWNELGGFPAWFGSMAEDLYLCCSARLGGYDLRVACSSGYYHWVGASFGGGKIEQGRLLTSYRRRALSERNKTFVMLICFPLPLLLLLFPIHFVTFHLEGITLSILKRDWGIWRKIYGPLLPQLWHARGHWLALRHKIQTTRHITIVRFVSVFRWLPWKVEALLRHGIPDIK